MFAIEFTRTAQRAICMMLSVIIVAGSLSLGAYGVSTAQVDHTQGVTVHA
jgi:hypothetical protein